MVQSFVIPHRMFRAIFENGTIGAGVIYTRPWAGTIAIAPRRQFQGSR
jgi:hypothetical protein